MSRLIDADKLLEELRECHPLSLSYGILSDIEYFPTAYDVDKVVEEVKHLIALEFSRLRVSIFEKEYIDLSKIDTAERTLRTKVIELIKAGGTE